VRTPADDPEHMQFHWKLNVLRHLGFIASAARSPPNASEAGFFLEML
jgi:hypothetical protein